MWHPVGGDTIGSRVSARPPRAARAADPRGRVGSVVMGSVHPFARQRSFDSETMQIMGVALDCAWYRLMVSGSPLTASFRAEHTRDALASRIIAAARRGERDIERLRDDAVAHVEHELDLGPRVLPAERPVATAPVTQAGR
jgi:hypothetical protein